MRRFVVVVAICVLLVGGLVRSAVAGTVTHPGVVSENPVDSTPHVLAFAGDDAAKEDDRKTKATVLALAVVDDVVVVGGRFAEVEQADGRLFRRANVFAYERRSGKVVDGFAPSITGHEQVEIRALEAGEGGTVYVGGRFNQVNGVDQRGLTQLRISDGARVEAFTGTVDGPVNQLVRRGGQLYLGGRFKTVKDTPRTAIARVDALTGAVDTNFAPTLAEPRVNPNDPESNLSVVGMAVNSAGTKLVITGNFLSVSGLPRRQIAIIDVTSTSAALSGWSTNRFEPPCPGAADTYMRDVDFAPDDTYFVVVTTGGPHDPDVKTLCDSATRWDATATSGDQQPSWTNWTGGDTLDSVTVTGAAVYVGGHQRVMNQQWEGPPGPESSDPQPRSGIAALHPHRGVALPWNPGRDRGNGAEILLTSTDGLLVGSDTEKLGTETHPRLGMFPLP